MDRPPIEDWDQEPYAPSHYKRMKDYIHDLEAAIVAWDKSESWINTESCKALRDIAARIVKANK